MSLEVANLVAKFTLEMEGVQSSISQMRQYTEQARNAGQVSEATAAQFDKASDAAEKQAVAYGKTAQAVIDSTAAINDMGVSVVEATRITEDWARKVEQARQEVKALQDQGKSVPMDLFNLAKGNMPEDVQAMVKALDHHKKTLEANEKQGVRTAGAMGILHGRFARVRGEAEAAQRPLRNLFRQLLSMNNGAIFTASGIASLIGRLTGLGLVATAVVRGVQKLIRTFREGAMGVDAFTRAGPELSSMVQNFKGLERIDLSQLTAQLDDVRIRLKNMGAVDPIAATQQVLDIAVDFQYLNATPDDLERTIQTILRTAQTLDFSALAEFDLGDVRPDDLTAKYQKLASQGIDRATLSTRAFAEMQNIVLNQQGTIAERAGAEQSTLQAALKRSEVSFRNALAANEDFTESVNNVATALETSMPTLEAVANMFGSVISGAVYITLDAIDGLRVIWAGLVAGLAKGANYLTKLFFDIEFPALNELDRASGVVQRQISILAELRQPYMQAMQAADAYATSLAKAGVNQAITVDFLEKLKRASGASTLEQRAATQAVLDSVDANRFSEDQLRLLRAAVIDYDKELAGVTDTTAEFKNSTTEALDSVKNKLTDAGKGTGAINALKNLGDAQKELEEFGDGQAAFKYYQAFEQVIAASLNGATADLAAFRTFVEEVLKPTLNTEDYDQLITLVELAEAGMAEADAESRLYAEAAGVAVEGTNEFAGAANEAEVAVGDLVGTVNEAVLAFRELEGPYEINFVANFPWEGMSGFGGGSAPPRPPRTAPTTSLLESNRVGTISPIPTAPSGPRAAETLAGRGDPKDTIRRAISESGAGGERGIPGATGVSDHLTRPSGGGGSSLPDIEAIREFMQEVNRAIAIASREGVRIGTAGNAIPFEEGSFLNSQGGNLSVDTILIRGVWDFADPAAKRQIIRELQEALTALQGEI